jgi:phage tail tape-measure protein
VITQRLGRAAVAVERQGLDRVARGGTPPGADALAGRGHRPLRPQTAMAGILEVRNLLSAKDREVAVAALCRGFIFHK